MSPRIALRKAPETYDPFCGGPTVDNTNTGGHELYFNSTSGEGSVRFKSCRWKWGIQNATLTLADNSNDNVVAKTEVLVYAIQQSTCFEYIPFWVGKQNQLSFGPAATWSSTLTQFFLFVSFSSIGDFGGYRLIMMKFAANIAAFLTMMIIAVAWNSGVGTASNAYAAGLMFVVANASFGLANVMYNAMLPLMTKDHPEVQALIGKKASPKDIVGEFKKQMQDMNDAGSGFGYMSGTGVLIFMLVPNVILPMIMDFGETRTYGVIFGLTGLYWLSVQQYCWCYLNSRPGPPLPGKDNNFLGLDYILFSWERVYTSIVNLHLLPHSFRFMLAYFVYSDTYNTIANVGVVWFTTTLGISTLGMAAIGVIVPWMCMFGVFFWNWMIVQKGWTPLSSIIFLMGLLTSMCVYALVSFIPNAPIGFVNQWEVWVFAFAYGFCLGPLQALSRTAFAELIPPGHESEFFADSDCKVNNITILLDSLR